MFIDAGWSGCIVADPSSDVSDTLHIIELDEPLAWTMHRIGEKQRLLSKRSGSSAGAKHSSILTESTDNALFQMAGREYLQFLLIANYTNIKGNLLGQALGRFRESIIHATHESNIIQEQYSSNNKTFLNQRYVNSRIESTKQAGIKMATALTSFNMIAMELEKILNMPNVVVLVDNYYNESLELLSNILGASSHFLASSQFLKSPEIGNKQVGSPLSLKSSVNQLELHQILYQVVLKKFYLQTYGEKS